MRRVKGKRYDTERKLNVKKVISFIVAIIVLVIAIFFFPVLIKVLFLYNSQVRYFYITLRYSKVKFFPVVLGKVAKPTRIAVLETN